MSKGSNVRPFDPKKYGENYDRIFRTETRKGRLSQYPCDRCGALEVYVTQDSNYDADYDIHCYGCRRHYRVDGPDS